MPSGDTDSSLGRGPQMRLGLQNLSLRVGVEQPGTGVPPSPGLSPALWECGMQERPAAAPAPELCRGGSGDAA